MSRPGDWNCRSCQHLNFQRRDSCQRCGESKHGGGCVNYGGEFGSFGSCVSYGNEFGSLGGRGSNLSVFGLTGPDVRPGDWYCNVGNCGAHNFASRSSCFKCGAFKDDLGTGGGAFDCEMARGRSFGLSGGSGGSSRSAWKSGDWICGRFGCNEHNFASRMECFKCNAPRELASKYSSY
ncbi:RNA-binding protein involved in heterochromatin assembly dri1-like [Rutidosis leptorrhynchoides]|uniref:RNA-binding protein involved in heterochromatin assembly dri1-like n=1 Tax=Rutidosis leptorrhynchoides TaxID=125765 RepID=UPI003A99C4D2